MEGYDNVWSDILAIRAEEVRNLLERSEPKLEVIVEELHYENDESWINFINE